MGFCGEPHLEQYLCVCFQVDMAVAYKANSLWYCVSKGALVLVDKKKVSGGGVKDESTSIVNIGIWSSVRPKNVLGVSGGICSFCESTD